jgi:hypothetical protein
MTGKTPVIGTPGCRLRDSGETVASKLEVTGEIRSLIVVEVQNQLKPLVEMVNRQDKTLRSLYANGSGGPPGYLEMARAEDKQQAARLFSKIDSVAHRIDKVEDFMNDHRTREEQREEDKVRDAQAIADRVAESERRSNRRMTIWMLVLAALMAIFGIWDHKKQIVHSLVSDQPAAHSQLVQPQTAGGLPPVHY